jgi:hypothetical protein
MSERRSADVTVGGARAGARAMLRAVGLHDEDLTFDGLVSRLVTSASLGAVCR